MGKLGSAEGWVQMGTGVRGVRKESGWTNVKAEQVELVKNVGQEGTSLAGPGTTPKGMMRIEVTKQQKRWR